MSHCPASWQKAWANPWVNCFFRSQSSMLPQAPAAPYNPTSPLPAHKPYLTLPFLCPGVLQDGGFLFQVLPPLCNTLCICWSLVAILNCSVGSYSLTRCRSFKKETVHLCFGKLPVNLSRNGFWWQYSSFKSSFFIITDDLRQVQVLIFSENTKQLLCTYVWH